nr:hypothetical protein CFP56_02832 [Quercus suber]
MSYPAETNDGTVTSWIPLTTLYTPARTCSDYFRLEGPSLVAFDPAYGLQIDAAVNCQPSAVTTWWEQGLLQAAGDNGGAGHTAVSILPLQCPAGWSTVATSTLNGISTLAMCCPNEYTLANEDPGSIDGNCWSNVPSGRVLTYASTADSDTADWTTATTTFDASSFVGAIAIVGWNVQQTLVPATTTASVATSTSIPSTTASTSSTSSTSASASTKTANRLSTSSSTSTTIQPTSSADSSDSLSAGAKAGIGLGAALGVIGVIALVIAVIILLRRRQSSPDPEPGATAVTYESERKEDFGPPTFVPPEPRYPGYHELSNNGIHELYHSPDPHELPAIGSPVELGRNRSVI